MALLSGQGRASLRALESPSLLPRAAPAVAVPPLHMDRTCGLLTVHVHRYDEVGVLEGWFYDLADLNHSVPFVREELLRWVRQDGQMLW